MNTHENTLDSEAGPTLERPNSIYTVGLKWDYYTPKVEAQLTKDIIGLNAETKKWPGTRLLVACDSNEADRILASLGIIRTSILKSANVWRTYQSGDSSVYAPVKGKAKTFAIVLNQKKSKSNILRQMDNDPGFHLQEQGRDYNFNPFDKAPPSNDSWNGSTNPLVNFIWTS